MKIKEPKQLPSDRIIPKILLTYEEAAWSIGVSEDAVKRLVGQGKLPVVKFNGCAKIDPGDLEALKNKHKIVRNGK